MRKSRHIARVLTIIDGIQRRPFKLSDKIGFEAEDKALEAARYFQKKKIVKKVELFERFSPDDKLGRDLMIELFDRQTIYLQITSAFHREKEIKSQEQNIFYLPVYPNDNDQVIQRKIFQIILYSYFSSLQPQQIRTAIQNLDGLKKGGGRKRLGLLGRFRQFFKTNKRGVRK